MNLNEADIELIFYETFKTFSHAESLHDNYFFAEYLSLTRTVDNKADGIIARLVLGNENEFIEEVVEYYIEE